MGPSSLKTPLQAGLKIFSIAFYRGSLLITASHVRPVRFPAILLNSRLFALSLSLSHFAILAKLQNMAKKCILATLVLMNLLGNSDCLLLYPTRPAKTPRKMDTIFFVLNRAK